MFEHILGMKRMTVIDIFQTFCFLVIIQNKGRLHPQYYSSIVLDIIQNMERTWTDIHHFKLFFYDLSMLKKSKIDFQ